MPRLPHLYDGHTDLLSLGAWLGGFKETVLGCYWIELVPTQLAPAPLLYKYNQILWKLLNKQ